MQKAKPSGFTQVFISVFLSAAITLGLSSCGGVAGGGPSPTAAAQGTPDGTLPAEAIKKPLPRLPRGSYSIDALLYTGAGAALADIESLKNILNQNGMSFRVVASDRLNTMTLDEVTNYGILIVPGGDALAMTNSLTSATRAKLKQAVQERGMSYIGFCAGSFLAANNHPSGGFKDWGIQLLDHPLHYYYLEDKGVDLAMTKLAFGDGTRRDIVWFGGPVIDGLDEIVAKYPDGSTAIAQGWVGNGFVMLSGPHPEAPDSWREGLKDSDGPDYDIAWNMIDSALHQKAMPAF